MAAPQVSKEDKIAGSLWGLAWGDVFGCPMEGWRQNNIKHVFGEYREFPEAFDFEKAQTYSKNIKSRFFKKMRPLGYHSDDTQQAMALINCCMRQPEWSTAAWTKWLTEGMRTNAWRGFGRNFSQAVKALKRKSPPEKSGSDSSGMGAAMRIGPIGAVYADNLDLLKTVCYESTLMTHGSITAASIAFATAYAVYCFVNGDSVAEIRTKISGVVREEEKRWVSDEKKAWEVDRKDAHIVSDTLAAVFNKPKLMSDRSAIRKFLSENGKKYSRFTVCHCNQGFAILGGCHGVIMALLDDIEPQEILREIVLLGYDTDTVAAICGSVLGARFGHAWIPKERLYDRERIETYCNLLVEKDSSFLEEMYSFMKRESTLGNEQKAWYAEVRQKWNHTPTKNKNDKNFKKRNKM